MVPVLRQFFQPGPAQKAANCRNPLLIRKKLAARIAGVTHRTKLDELERHAVLTRPPLAEKYRAARRDQDADADKQDKGGTKRDTHQTQHYFDDAQPGSGPSPICNGLRTPRHGIASGSRTSTR